MQPDIPGLGRVSVIKEPLLPRHKLTCPPATEPLIALTRPEPDMSATSLGNRVDVELGRSARRRQAYRVLIGPVREGANGTNPTMAPGG